MAFPLTEKTTVRDLVGRYPQTRQIFEKAGIDYCCGGGKSLAEAAAEHEQDLDKLIGDLTQAINQPITNTNSIEKDWYVAPLTELVNHIVDKHHTYMKSALPRARSLIASVLKAHTQQHGEMLRQLHAIFNDLYEEISNHLMKEEQVLFPFIISTETQTQQGGPMPLAPCGSVCHPIRQMEYEHENAGLALKKLREITNNYSLPPDACPMFHSLYEELQNIEADLHQHIHLENNILFPQIIASEQQKS